MPDASARGFTLVPSCKFLSSHCLRDYWNFLVSYLSEGFFEVLPCLQKRMMTIIDLVARLPVKIWFCDNPKRSDTKFESDLLASTPSKTLLLLDRGFYHFQFFADLIAQQVNFITRLKAKAKFEVERQLSRSYCHQDQLILLGCANVRIFLSYT